MTERTGSVTASDATLIARTRRGDDAAFHSLAARHRGALDDLAALLGGPTDDLVDEALDTAFQRLRRVHGPTVWVRGHLLQLVCQLHAQHLTPGWGPVSTIGTREQLVEDAVPFRDHQLSGAHDAVATEFAGLAEAWQAALWHRTAERETDTEVATVVGVSPAIVTALVDSARDELRRSLLGTRWAQPLPAPCRAHTRRLAASRHGVPPRAVLRHTAVCRGCAQLVADLDAVDRELPEVLARHLLGGVGDAYLELRQALAHERVSVR